MLTLAVDTTGDFGSIALVDETGTREELLLHQPQGFSHILFEEIEALLARQSVKLNEIGLFAGASGPGSFTGVRIGLAAMKGLGEVLGRGVTAVSNLQAVASFGTAPLRAAVIDARRGEFFCGLYDADRRLVGKEMVLPFPDLLSRLPEAPLQWVSTDLASLVPHLAGTRFGNDARIQAPQALAGAVARIAIARRHVQSTTDPAAIEANYVRRSDAELFWKET